MTSLVLVPMFFAAILKAVMLILLMIGVFAFLLGVTLTYMFEDICAHAAKGKR